MAMNGFSFGGESMRSFCSGFLLAFILLPLLLFSPEKADKETTAGTPVRGVDLDWEKTDMPETEASLTLSTGQGKVEKKLYFSQNSEGLAYFFPNGDIFWQQKAYDGEKPGKWIIDSQHCRLRYYDDAQKEWVILEDPESFQGREMLFISFDSDDFILSPPFAYEEIERSCLKEIPKLHGSLYLERLENDKWEIGLTWPEQEAGKFVVRHWWMLASEAPLIDWTNPAMEEIWPVYRFTGEMRWCWYGMYQQTPDSYKPGGEGIFFLNPASYIPCRFVLTGGSRAAEDLALAMLDLIRQNYTESGYVPTSTGSNWLEQEYGIGAFYFDTRWNTDLAEAYLLAGEKFAVREFTHTALEYADFLCKHIETHSFSLPGMKQGVLVSDYGWRDSSVKSHCSLNHQLAEALFLYHTGVPYYISVADLLLLGIEESGLSWIKEDGDLQYGIRTDGSFIGKDYPALTYHDLSNMQSYLEKSRGDHSKMLDELIRSKAKWMEEQGIALDSR